MDGTEIGGWHPLLWEQWFCPSGSSSGCSGMPTVTDSAHLMSSMADLPGTRWRRSNGQGKCQARRFPFALAVPFPSISIACVFLTQRPLPLFLSLWRARRANKQKPSLWQRLRFRTYPLGHISGRVKLLKIVLGEVIT